MYTTRTTLLEKIAAGDEVGWSEFLETYRGLIHSLAGKAGVPEGEQDDIVQEVMLGVFHNGNFIYQREKHGKFRTWFGGIIRHKIGDYMAAKVKREKIGTAASERDLLKNEQADLEAFFLNEYRDHLLNLALEELKSRVEPEIYETFALCRTGCSDKEAAQKLGIRSNTVTIRKRRCVEILNGIIRSLNESDPDLKLPPS